MNKKDFRIPIHSSNTLRGIERESDMIDVNCDKSGIIGREQKHEVLNEC